jgi:hypothetical protein
MCVNVDLKATKTQTSTVLILPVNSDVFIPVKCILDPLKLLFDLLNRLPRLPRSSRF